MIDYFKYEFIIQNKISNLTKYFLIFFTFSSVSISVATSVEAIPHFGTIFTIIAIPLAVIGITSNILRPDIEDGTLELSLVTFNPLQIILVKYLSLLASGLIGFISNASIAYLLFSVSPGQLILIIICGTLLTSSSMAVILLISAIQSYFRSNTNFLSILVLPLLIPDIILTGLIIQSNNSVSLIMILIGINCIIIPSAIYFSSYLIANIYNI